MADEKFVNLYKKNEGETVYYAPYKSHSFTIPKKVKNKKGEYEYVPVTNTMNGMPVTDGMGNQQYAEITIKSRPHRVRFSEHGYWCVHVVTPDMEPYIKDEIEKDVASRKSPLMTEAQFIQRVNPALAEYITNQAASDAKDSENQSLREEIAALQAALKKKSKTKPPTAPPAPPKPVEAPKE